MKNKKFAWLFLNYQEFHSVLTAVCIVYFFSFQAFMSPRYPGGPRGPGPVRMPPNQVDFNVSF